NLDWLMQKCPWTALTAHGTHVGLPTDKDMGNSEVGHNAIGAGRTMAQGAKLVDFALETGAAWDSPVWKSLVAGTTLHLLGLVSDGNVHSHVKHLEALIARAAIDGVQRLRLHILTDGRDVEPRSALTWIEPLEANLANHQEKGRDYQIASGGGRMNITMDRYESNWAMVERGWRCHVLGEGRRFSSAKEAIKTLYVENPNIDDQHLPAFVIEKDGQPNGRIADGNSVFLFNFRGDRAIEISRVFEEDDFTAFNRPARPDVYYAGMMQYDGDTNLPQNYLVAPPNIDHTVGEYLALAQIRTFACSETQKFGHVTYFFNGNRSGYFDEKLEKFVEVPSDLRPFEERPWMKAAEVCDTVVDAIHSGDFDHIRLNFANGDMVGHTGDLVAAIYAVEAVDLQLGRLVQAVRQESGVLLVTADHGNADEMHMRKKGIVSTDENGPLPKTSHTLNKVPFIIFDPTEGLRLRDSGVQRSLPAIGATLLELCGLVAPEFYLPSLIEKLSPS
ncbi:MAG: 2,3-bisphosphoglycerate-independent phosphoglycerate mutase, partial [Proteobacteria bacterium]|nr:2,3-bisphosphoglycerate-independent phosphoglycerate mutase [Pseudomonadota bacterium]